MDDTIIKEMKKDRESEEIRTDNLLRETSNHYIRMIGDADRKARIMIVVNSILLMGGVTIITRVIHQEPLVWISASLLIVANLITLFFAIVSVKPELHSHTSKETKDNMLHYKKCMEYSLEDYITQMLATLHDNDKKIMAVIKELYYYGSLLNQKYRLMKIAYRFFLWGTVAAVGSYLVILLFTKSAMFGGTGE